MKVNSQIKSLRKQAGYTLIELSIAIAIISVLIMTALFGVQKILENNNVNTASQQVTLATANINKYAVMLSDKAFVATTAGAAALGIWPDNIVTKNATGVVTKVSNPFGGEYLTATTANGYYIVITNVPVSACLATVAAFGNTASAIDTDEAAISIATTPLLPASGKNAKAITEGKVNQANMATACTPTAAGITKKNVWVTYAL